MGSNINSKDPLKGVGTDYAKILFEKMSQQAANNSAADVMGASVNLIINALRQTYSTRDKASQAFDELFGKAKTALMEQYDSTGRKKGIFPYDQVIHVPHFDLSHKN